MNSGDRPGGFGRRAVAGVVTSCLLVAGCASPTSDSSDSPSSPTAETSTFANPVYATDFPDPMIVRRDEGWIAVATNGNGSNVQTAVSPDLVSWTQGDDALPDLPEWTTPGKVWAPEIAVHSAERSVLYYTTPAPDGLRQCISVAVGRRAEGPYVDSSRAPLVCDDADRGGSIDPHPFRDEDGRRYLYWKNDGNAVGADTYLWVQRLTDDGTRLTGRPQKLIHQDLDWEGRLIEAPFVIRAGATYHLFYSANDYGSWSYTEGHATGPSPTGPFRKDPEPVLVSNDVAAGPGGGALVVDDDRVWMAFHAWEPDAIGSEIPGRQMWLSEVTLESDGAFVEPPETANADPPS